MVCAILDPSTPNSGTVDVSANVRETIAITGATGYIGRATIKAALARGFAVVALGRRPVAGIPSLQYRLEDEGPIDALAGCAAVIHLAADTAAGGLADIALESNAAARLIGEARRHGAHIIFASSQSAGAAAPSAYGRAKWTIEQMVHEAGGGIVRPGLVYGGEARGLFGQLCRLVERLPVLPAFVPAPRVQPIHVDDLAAGLVNAAAQRLRGTWQLASEPPITLTSFIRLMARIRLRRWRLFVPVPPQLLFPLEPVLRRLVRNAPDLAQLRALYATKPMETSRDTRAAGIVSRPLSVGLARGSNGQRRALLGEGRTLLAYLLKAAPPPSLLRRYVRAIVALDRGRPLTLPAWTAACPALLALIEQTSARLGRRISWATRISESSIAGSARFQPHASYQPVCALALAGWAAMSALAALTVRAALAPVWRGVGRTIERDAP